VESFYKSCYSGQQVLPSIGSYRLPRSTDDHVEGVDKVCSHFVQGILLFTCSCVRSMGYVDGSGGKVFAATWHVPGHGEYWGSLDFSTGSYETNAPDPQDRAGLGLLGFGAALHTRSTAFQAAWLEFLQDAALRGAAAINEQAIVLLASESAAALEQAGGAEHPWVRVEAEQEAAPLVQDLRDYFATSADYVQMLNAFMDEAQYETRFQGPQLRLLRGLLRRRKHTVLIGPPGTGKSISAFEALALEGFTKPGVDYQLFTAHDEVRSADFLGAWQPSGGADSRFTWVDAVLVRAMTGNGGRGQPILVEEWTRMPTRAQNVFVSALSDGYVVLNEKHSADGSGEIVRAGPDFVLIADMNADPAADDIEMYGAAFGSRVRKVEYAYPTLEQLSTILADTVPGLTAGIEGGIVATYDAVMKRWGASELAQPVSPRACVHWAEEILAELQQVGTRDSASIRSAAVTGAELTWLRDVAGADHKARETLVEDIEAQFRKSTQAIRKAA
jgi:MoxR-like ATPase